MPKIGWQSDLHGKMNLNLWGMNIMSAHVFVTFQNLPKISLRGNCHTSAPIKATKVHKVLIFKYWAQLSVLKMRFLIKCLVVAIYKVEVKI